MSDPSGELLLADRKLIETTERRIPQFQNKLDELIRLMSDTPQIADGELVWVYGGSTAYMLAGLASTTQLVDGVTGGVHDQADIFTRPSIRGLLLTPTVMPHDVDIIHLDPARKAPPIEDVFIGSPRRVVRHTINDRTIYSVHPEDQFIDAVLFQVQQGVQTDQIPQKANKFERVISAFQYEWPVDAIADSLVDSIKDKSAAQRVLLGVSEKNRTTLLGINSKQHPVMNSFLSKVCVKLESSFVI